MNILKSEEMEMHIAQKIEELQQFLSRGGSLSMLRGVSSDQLDALYDTAYECLEERDYQGARNLFALLVYANHWNIEYWLGLGISEQRLGAHESALCAFARAESLAMQDPRSRFYAALSYQLVGEKNMALKAISSCLLWCGSIPAYRALREQAEAYSNIYKDKETAQ